MATPPCSTMSSVSGAAAAAVLDDAGARPCPHGRQSYRSPGSRAAAGAGGELERPCVDEALAGAEQPPWLEGDAEQRSDQRHLGERELPRAQADERVCRHHHVGGNVGRDGPSTSRAC
ncbi:Os07g0598250 [Oryza sativa Japonica Group]|uniref:Os07g0598250 protein n=1 Tax=Oryza sativa subsp. japonica TaxID=39947 RepID=A0A0P0X8D5_ORYSJ|nr:Os07g0598250 [Oryza sativa Japonica Group]